MTRQSFLLKIRSAIRVPRLIFLLNRDPRDNGNAEIEFDEPLDNFNTSNLHGILGLTSAGQTVIDEAACIEPRSRRMSGYWQRSAGETSTRSVKALPAAQNGDAPLGVERLHHKFCVLDGQRNDGHIGPREQHLICRQRRGSVQNVTSTPEITAAGTRLGFMGNT